MQTTTQTAPASKMMLWTGRIVSAIPVLLILLAGVMKLMKPVAVVQGFVQSGYPESLVIPIGIIEVVCVVIYLIPRTSILGAILLTGFLGGATATNVRVGNSAFYMTVLLGVLVWGGLFFRENRLRALIPFRR